MGGVRRARARSPHSRPAEIYEACAANIKIPRYTSAARPQKLMYINAPLVRPFSLVSRVRPRRGLRRERGPLPPVRSFFMGRKGRIVHAGTLSFGAALPRRENCFIDCCRLLSSPRPARGECLMSREEVVRVHARPEIAGLDCGESRGFYERIRSLLCDPRGKRSSAREELWFAFGGRLQICLGIAWNKMWIYL